MTETKTKREQTETKTKQEQPEIKENKMAQYRGYKRAEATFEITRDMLGTDPADEETCLKNNVKQLNILPRDDKGNLRIKPWWIRASLRDTSNIIEVSKNLSMNYIYDYQTEVLDGKSLKPYVKSITIQPIDKGVKQGRISTYEILPKGLKFKVSCLIPTEGVRSIKPTLFKKWIEYGLRQGIGSIRKGEYGTCKLIDFKVHNKI